MTSGSASSCKFLTAEVLRGVDSPTADARGCSLANELRRRDNVTEVVPQQSCQSSEIAPVTEGLDVVFAKGGTAVAPAQREDPELGIGRPIAFHSQAAPPPLPDRLDPSQGGGFREAMHRATWLCNHQRTRKTIRSHWTSLSAKDDGM